MKCPLKVQLHLCRGCPPCPASCCEQISSPDSNGDRQDTYNMFDLMAQNMPDVKVNKLKTRKTERNPTQYRDDYCRKRRVPSPARLRVPFPSLFVPSSDRKMCCETTHKSDYRRHKKKEIEKLGNIVVKHRDDMVCPKSKFDGKSETKTAYCKPKNGFEQQHQSEAIRNKQNKENIKIPDTKMESSTTYKSTYRRPKNFKRSEMLKPNEPRKSPAPFTHTTQYQCDFKKPKKVER